MGSLDNALMTGFICRLCSRMNKVVIHIFGEEGEKRELARKIDLYLPINTITLGAFDHPACQVLSKVDLLVESVDWIILVNVNDPLPKTVCSKCIEKLEIQHKLVEMSKKSVQMHKELKEKMKQARMMAQAPTQA